MARGFMAAARLGAALGVWRASGACSPISGTLARLCPDGSYQDQNFVFSCAGIVSGRSSAELVTDGLNLTGLSATGAQLAQVELPGDATVNVTMLPAGLVDFSVTISGYDPAAYDSDLKLLILDPLSGNYSVNYDGGVVNETNSSGSGINGVDVVYTYNGHEQISFTGATDRPLMLQVKNRHSTDKTSMLAYSFASVGAPTCSAGTTQPPVGCRPYKKFTARAAVVSFSYWAQKQYDGDADSAWTGLVPASCSDGAEVPYYRWGEVWRQWPGCIPGDDELGPEDGCRPTQVDWEETFRYISMNSPGWVITRADFDIAFNHANAAIQTSLCFSYLRSQLTEDEGLAMSSEPTSFRSAIGTTCGVTDVAAANATFNFVDADSNSMIDSDEFRKSWGFDKQCPHNTIRNQTVIFKPYPVKGFSKMELLPQEQTVIANVPAGVEDLWVNASCQSDCDILLYDANAHVWILHWDADTGYINRRTPKGSYPNITLHPEATPAVFCYGGELVDTQQHSEESIMVLDAPTPTSFDIRLMNYAGTTNEVTVSYEYNTWNPPAGTTMPYGCQSFDVLEGRTACMNFSSWVSDATRTDFYSGSADAFSRMTAAGSGGNVGHPSYAVTSGDVTYIPFHFFEGVWSQWPQSTQVPNWQQCFGYADADHSDYIDQEEFNVIYSLSTTVVAVTQYCEYVRAHNADSLAAWLNVAGAYKSVPLEVWTQHWDAFNTRTVGGSGYNVTTTVGDTSFHFLDFNDDLVITSDEYIEGCFESSMGPTSERPPFGSFELISDSEVFTQMQNFQQGTNNAEHEAARGQCDYIGETTPTTTSNTTTTFTTTVVNATTAPVATVATVAPVTVATVATTTALLPCAERESWYNVDIGIVDMDPCTYTTTTRLATVPLATLPPTLPPTTTLPPTLPPTTTTTVHPYTNDRIAVDGSLQLGFQSTFSSSELEASLDNEPALLAIATALASALSTTPGIVVTTANVTVTGVNPASTSSWSTHMRRLEGSVRHPRRMTESVPMDIDYEVAAWPDWDPTNLMNDMRAMNEGTSASSSSFTSALGQNLAAIPNGDPALTDMATQINTGQVSINPPPLGTETVRSRSVHGDLDRNSLGGMRNWAEEEEAGFSGWWLLIIPLLLLCCAVAAVIFLRGKPRKNKTRALRPEPEYEPEDQYEPLVQPTPPPAPQYEPIAQPYPMPMVQMTQPMLTSPVMSQPSVRLQQPMLTSPMMTSPMMTSPMMTSPMMTQPMNRPGTVMHQQAFR